MAISWRNCVVPQESLFVWVAYRSEKPYLPFAIADTAEELAELVGVKRCTVLAAASRFRDGKLRRAKYARVYVGGEA